jgi:hypothetical protein
VEDRSQLEDSRQLAVIKRAHVAYEDHSQRLALFFDVYTSEARSSLQIVSLPDLPSIPGIAWDVSRLDGRVCWVHVGDGLVKFIDWWRD